MTRVCAAMGFAAFALLQQAASRARADTPHEPSLNVVRLVGAESCDGGGSLARAVDARLGHRAFASPESASGAVEVVLSHEGANFRAEVRSYDAAGALSGVRSVQPQARTCAALTEAVAVVLSVMIDPAAALGPPPAATPEKPAEVPAFAPPVAEPLAAPQSAPPTVVKRTLAVFTRALFGVLPAPGIALGAAFERSVRFGGVRFDGSASFAQKERRAVRSEGVRIAVASLAALYCPLYLERSIVRFSACIGAEAGAWYLSTFGVMSGTHKTAPLLAGTGRVGVSIALGGHAALQLGAAADALALRPEYTFAVADGTRETAYRAPALTGLVDAGLAVRF